MNSPLVKRALDVLLASTALVILAPALLVIAGWLTVAGGGSVLYGEQRLGRFGRPFRIHKFRTLREGSPREPTVAVVGDTRITKPGRWLRRWRLDELPQLYDVLVGTMSLVGPRPQTPANLDAIDGAARERLQRVRPGLTGPAAIEFLAEDEVLAEVVDPATVYRRILLPAKVRVELDYLERRTLWADLRILLLTPIRVLSGPARRRSLASIRRVVAHARPDLPASRHPEPGA